MTVQVLLNILQDKDPNAEVILASNTKHEFSEVNEVQNWGRMKSDGKVYICIWPKQDRVAEFGK